MSGAGHGAGGGIGRTSDIDIGIGVWGWLMILCVALGLLFTAIDKISEKTDCMIKHIWPSYEVREEKVRKWQNEWQKTKNFFANSETQFIVTGGKPTLPQADLVFLAQGKVVKSKADGLVQRIVSNISAGKYIDGYDRRWMMTEATPEESPKYYRYQSDYVFSPDKKRAVYMEIKKQSYLKVIGRLLCIVLIDQVFLIQLMIESMPLLLRVLMISV